ncbi:MAG: alanine--tRNA ligase [Gammaproteobacteria bacterium]
MNTAELRQAFLQFFEQEQHTVLPSSALVPSNDPTLLFTNAGMVQFKDVFLGDEARDYVRAATSQRCVRAGGKHNDLENVGYTARHHTFFEMLGNFSFGDYFKEEAIRFAWRFLTESLKLPEERLWVTVYEDDDEAADLWIKTMGVDPNRFTRMGAKDNFWSMGDTGPCGPCSEIFYDHGPDVAGGPPGSPEEDGDRYTEVWNLVFMQFDRAADGTMTPLPKPSVDTGMGLERIAAVMQGVHSNYDIDLFARLIDAVVEVTGATDRSNASLRVIADHIRACSFLIIDGVLPSREGRGYVLRRIIRRAVRHGYKLGVKETFFYRLVAALEAVMGEAYPEISRQREHVERVLRQEEERFALTLSQGMGLLEDAIAKLDGNVLPGDIVFRLSDTYGFPMDLTADIARERRLTIDEPGFERAMEEQRERARAASKFGSDDAQKVRSDATTAFEGYNSLVGGSEITEMYVDGAQVSSIQKGQRATIVVARTPFYAESGGQVGDAGRMTAASGAAFAVADTQKIGNAHGHLGTVENGTLSVGDDVTLHVDATRRQNTVLNHSATHLLHAALRQVLGDHVTQKGSLVAPDKLRFDFSHYEPVTEAHVIEIERLVNEQVRGNTDAQTRLMSYPDAIESGAMALFGEKYDDEVRVLRLGDFSTELCGGTHVERVGDIGLFKVIQETGIASGVRRIEAITGDAALEYVGATEQLVRDIAGELKASRDDVLNKVTQAVAKVRAMEKEMAQLKQELVGSKSGDLSSQAREIGGLKVLATQMDGADAGQLRSAVDQLKDKLGDAVVVLGAVEDGKVRLVAGVSKSATSRVKAGDVIKAVAEQVGGRGGGRPDMAQAGGSDPAALPAALESVYDWVSSHIATVQ